MISSDDFFGFPPRWQWRHREHRFIEMEEKLVVRIDVAGTDSILLSRQSVFPTAKSYPLVALDANLGERHHLAHGSDNWLHAGTRRMVAPEIKAIHHD